MQNKLPYLARYLIALLIIFVINGVTTELYSQVIFNDNRSKEILFTDQLDQQRQSGSVVSLKNYSKILSSELTIIGNDWTSESDVLNSAAYIFSRNADGFVSPGHINIEGVNEKVENAFSIKNASTGNFGRLSISTDFIVKNAKNSGEISLVLMVKNPEGEWIDAGRGLFIPDSEKEEDYFSIQISVSDIFIQKDEIIDLMWVNRSADKESYQLFTQRIEISPDYSDTHSFRQGGLLITELMPIGELDGYAFEYIEIYNPDDSAKSLKGITIETAYGTHIIQSDIEIPPYGYYVLSNADFSEVENVENSYFYSSKRLFSDSESNGRVEIKQNGELVASAVFESAEVNISFEAERMAKSVDGYSGLQNLQLSTNSFMAEVKGSPGVSGTSLPVYHKTFINPGVYLIAMPGSFYNNSIRIQEASFYSVNGNLLQPAEIEPFVPVFMVKSGSDQLALSVEGETDSQDINIRIYNTDTHHYISPVKPGFYSVRELFTEREVWSQPVAGVWNDNRERVEMANSDEAVTDLWKPVIINRSDDGEALNSRPGAKSPFNSENTFIFSLFEIHNDTEFFQDVVWIEINDENQMDPSSQQAHYFSEPLFYMPGLHRDRESTGTVLYGSSPGIEKSALSYFKLRTDKNKYTEFSVGTFNAGQSEQKRAVLKWELPNNIPEEWKVTLTDRVTGQEFDMRSEDYLRFSLRAQPEKSGVENTGQNSIQPIEINPGEKERFSVRFEPPNLTVNSDDDTERPGSIELRQNYPNPFNPSTNITFYLPEERQVRLGIYNIVGQQVATLVDDNIGEGEHSVVWNASNNPSGIYIVQLETGSRILTRKITLVK